jgi:hypothetical protein
MQWRFDAHTTLLPYRATAYSVFAPIACAAISDLIKKCYFFSDCLDALLFRYVDYQAIFVKLPPSRLSNRHQLR